MNGTPEQRPILRAALKRLFEASALFDSQRLHIWDAQGLTVTQLRLLSYVAQKEGISNAELADRLFVTRPSVSALLDRLERGGFLRREISPADRRGIRIWLEERGRTAVTTVQKDTYAFGEHLLGRLSDTDLVELETSLAKLVACGRRQLERDRLAAREPEHRPDTAPHPS